MFIKSLNLNLKDRSTLKIIIIIFLALLVATFLILITVINVFKESKIINFENEDDFFKLKSYSVKASISIVSNKNTNLYGLEELYYKDKDEKEMHNITTINKDNVKINYIINGSEIYIKNEEEKSDYRLSNYVINKNNLLSVSTFINLYNDVQSNCDYNCTKVENIVYDNLIRYKISFNRQNDMNLECPVCSKYKDILNSGINITKLELVYDENKFIPLEYIVYSGDQAIIDINFTEFDINKEFEEKVFAF